MKKEITNIPIVYNSLRLALTASIFSFPVIAIVFLFSLFSANPTPPSNIIFITAPIITAITVFILTVAFCLIYNFISKIIGGIKIEINNK